jgi:hypothetical protein
MDHGTRARGKHLLGQLETTDTFAVSRSGSDPDAEAVQRAREVVYIELEQATLSIAP